ncbi:ROK family transcriptional regulator [Paenibacillus sp. HN-1]|uniref:ROK family transcriptional regulator n=1 Tax=Paenibacillus TaxID=44249 RepID=UPI001CA869DE|nr:MULTISPECIES: ROK family transcriptional regulator [Paenibacillus]MBY9080119.1 ROK family transcriptional regulator [Paenibacillus sp. CGMCC 1.18879]MBY9086817.1 ROK family transcriptional regulator [Paenibacillus sinensis]
MHEGTNRPKAVQTMILRKIRTALLKAGSSTKAELSRQLGISFPTVGKFLSLMEKEGEIFQAGLDESSGGRRALRYAYNPEHMLGLALFLERKETGYTVVNSLGEVKERGNTPGVLNAGIESLDLHIQSFLDRYPRIGVISIGIPGAVDGTGKIIHIPDYPQFHYFDLKQYCESRYSIPAVVENDMNAAVLGYYDRMTARDRSSLVYLYFGQNGPGAGILVNGEIVRGKSCFSGEVSFVPQYDNRNFGQALGRGEEANNGVSAAVDPAARLVASLAAILNPDGVIFNREEVSGDMLKAIASASAAYIPAEHLPELKASDWRQDYLYGLQRLGLDLLISETAPYLEIRE